MSEINIIQNMPGNGASLISRLLPYSNAFMQLAGAYGRMLGGGQSGAAYLAQRDMQEIQGQTSYNLLARSVYNQDFYSLNSMQQDLIVERVREVAQEAKWRQEAAAWQDSHLGTDPRFNPYIPENMRGRITTDSLTRAYNALAQEQAAYSNITQPRVPGGRPYDLNDSNYNRFDTSTAPPGYHWDRYGNLVADSTEDRGTDRTRETDIDQPPPPTDPTPPIEDPTDGTTPPGGGTGTPEAELSLDDVETKEQLQKWVEQEKKRGETTESLWKKFLNMFTTGQLRPGIRLGDGAIVILGGDANGGEGGGGTATTPTTTGSVTTGPVVTSPATTGPAITISVTTGPPPVIGTVTRPPAGPTDPGLHPWNWPGYPTTGTPTTGTGTTPPVTYPVTTTPATTTPVTTTPTITYPVTTVPITTAPPPVTYPATTAPATTAATTAATTGPGGMPDLGGLTGASVENQWGHPGAGSAQPIAAGLEVRPSAVSLLDFDWDGKENKKSGLSSLLGEAFSWRGALSK